MAHLRIHVELEYRVARSLTHMKRLPLGGVEGEHFVLLALKSCDDHAHEAQAAVADDLDLVLFETHHFFRFALLLFFSFLFLLSVRVVIFVDSIFFNLKGGLPYEELRVDLRKPLNGVGADELLGDYIWRILRTILRVFWLAGDFGDVLVFVFVFVFAFFLFIFVLLLFYDVLDRSLDHHDAVMVVVQDILDREVVAQMFVVLVLELEWDILTVFNEVFIVAGRVSDLSILDFNLFELEGPQFERVFARKLHVLAVGQFPDNFLGVQVKNVPVLRVTPEDAPFFLHFNLVLRRVAQVMLEETGALQAIDIDGVGT